MTISDHTSGSNTENLSQTEVCQCPHCLKGTKTLLSQLSLPIPISTAGNPNRQCGRQLYKLSVRIMSESELQGIFYLTPTQPAPCMDRTGTSILYLTICVRNTNTSLPRAYFLQIFPWSGVPWCYVSLTVTADVHLQSLATEKKNSML